MRLNKTLSMILFLIAGLLFLPELGIAQTADANAPNEEGITLGVQARLDLLASEAESYNYRVGDSPAMDFSLDELCGLKEPDGWAEEASFRMLGNLQSLPSSFDWRTVGLPPVRNQGGCGSCWAFGTMGPLESQIMIQSGTAVDLSEQYLVSCNESGWDCGGGWWAHDYHEWRMPTGELEAGAVLEADFPYQASDVACNSPHSHAYRIDNWAYVPGNENDIDEIKQAIYQYGPVAAAVAVGPAFQAYSEGVFDNDESGSVGINHAIVPGTAEPTESGSSATAGDPGGGKPATCTSPTAPPGSATRRTTSSMSMPLIFDWSSLRTRPRHRARPHLTGQAPTRHTCSTAYSTTTWVIGADTTRSISGPWIPRTRSLPIGGTRWTGPWPPIGRCAGRWMVGNVRKPDPSPRGFPACPGTDHT